MLLLGAGLWLLLPAALPAAGGVERYDNGSLWLPSNWMPPNKSDLGEEIDKMLIIIAALTTAVMVGVFICMAAFLYLYRERPGSGRKARYTHGNNTVEIIWTVIPSLILVVLAFMSNTRWADAKKIPPKGETNEYRIVGKQFAWEIYYPGRDGTLKSDDDFKIDGMLYLEQGVPALITLASDDVIHSLSFPDFRIKQDAMPGREVKVWFTPRETGRFQIACAEFCGNGHTGMKASLEVLSSEDFAAAMEKQIAIAEEYGEEDGW